MGDGDKKPSPAKLLELERVRQEHHRKLRAVALESTWVMATMVLWPSVAEKHYYEPTHKPIWDWLDQSPVGAKRGLVCTREFRKTMYNVARCVRLLCKYPDIRLMIMSAYQRTATDMCGLVKRQFLINQDFRKVFPEFAIDDVKFGKQDEFTVPWRTMSSLLDPSFFATYLGAPLISRRADILVLDDPVDEDMVANPDVAQTTMNKFTECIPLVDKTSDFRQTFFIGTIKAHNDPANMLLGHTNSTEVQVKDKEAVAGWEMVTRPIAYIPNGNFYTGGEFAFPDENPESKPALPNVHTPKIIREIYEECCRNPAKGEAYFYREFACRVQAPGDQKFQAEWFDTWVPRLPSNVVFSGMGLDSAIKDEQILFRGDHSVLLVGHFDAYGHLYLTDGARSRGWKADDLKRFMVSMAENPRNMGVSNFLKEKIGEGALFALVKGWFNDARRPLTTHPLKVIGQGKKYLRITEALQGPAMGRKIHFVEGFPKDIHKAIVDEATHLGQWGHDDAIDCLSLFFHPDIRVVPEHNKPVNWVDVVARPIQISTAWTNPGALSAMRMAEEAGKPKGNPRLSPFGEEIGVDWNVYLEGSPGPTSMPEDLPWEKID